MTIQFNCPTCKKTLHAPGKKAGEYVTCPHCQSFFPVPQGPDITLEPSAPPAIETIAQWHFLINQQQFGPVSLDQLRQLTTTGQLRPNDMVWRRGMAQWTPAANVGELAASFASLLPPPPPVIQATPLPEPKQGRTIIEVLAHLINTTRIREKHPALAKWSDKAIVVCLSLVFCCLFLCCGGVNILTVMDEKAAKYELRDANDLWAKGQKAEAAGKYKYLTEKRWSSSAATTDRPTILQRLIDFEADQGNGSYARSLIEKAQDNNISLVLNSTKANELLTRIQREKKEREDTEIAKKKEREKTNDVAVKQPTTSGSSSTWTPPPSSSSWRPGGTPSGNPAVEAQVKDTMREMKSSGTYSPQAEKNVREFYEAFKRAGEK